jgi:hypothetical protein
MKPAEALLQRLPALAPLLDGADHLDVKTIDGAVSLRTFVAGMLSYEPAWIRALYAVRWFFVRLLGMKQEKLTPSLRMEPDVLPMTPGERVTLFSVALAEEERHWVAGITESHLTAYLGVVVEPRTEGRRFHVFTLVHYNRWTGPVYFNVIRPFHHLVVRRMMEAGVRAPEAAAAEPDAAPTAEPSPAARTPA